MNDVRDAILIKGVWCLILLMLKLKANRKSIILWQQLFEQISQQHLIFRDYCIGYLFWRSYVCCLIKSARIMQLYAKLTRVKIDLD